jgi:Ca-activated chloride channel family protein
MASDGDLNVGMTSESDLHDFVEKKRETGIYLSVLGFGTGNLRDDIMETLAANGNGNYSYIDTLMTAEKVLVEEMGANMFVAAKDVKAQLEFNKEYVKEFRLVGYENRLMSSEEFGDENKDAGEIGAGTDIVVLVELVLEDGEVEITDEELLKVCIRYKSVETGE